MTHLNMIWDVKSCQLFTAHTLSVIVIQIEGLVLIWPTFSFFAKMLSHISLTSSITVSPLTISLWLQVTLPSLFCHCVNKLFKANSWLAFGFSRPLLWVLLWHVFIRLLSCPQFFAEQTLLSCWLVNFLTDLMATFAFTIARFTNLL